MWQKGFLEEHARAPRWPELPEWIDKAQWNLATASSKLYGCQNIMAMSDVAGAMGVPMFDGAGAMAALRGIPDEPPKWLIKKAWKQASNSRYAELRVLEQLCQYDAAVGIRQMFDREENRKKCPHVFEAIMVHGKPMAERVCGKCGTLESMTLV